MIRSLTVIGCCLLFCACGRNAAPVEQAPLPIPVITLHATDTVIRHDYVADIQSLANVEVRARVAGFLKSIHVDEGQQVRQGQLLFQIDPQQFRTAVQKAESDVSSARADARVAEVEMQRVKGLVEKHIISATELELAKAKVAAAQASIARATALREEATAQLSYTSIRAPFDGVIDRIPLKRGSLITDGALLTTISDNKQMYAYFHVSENEYLRQQGSEHPSLAPDKQVQLILANGTTYDAEGVVETQEGEFDDNTGSIAYRAKFENKDGLLKHGASGKIRVTKQLESAILVPQKSVLEIQDKNYVFTLAPDSSVHMRAFEPKARLDQYFIVGSGLAKGETIVYEGIQNIRDSARIHPKPFTGKPMAAVLNGSKQKTQ
jgi:RND family efflux transporter MFP subunit